MSDEAFRTDMDLHRAGTLSDAEQTSPKLLADDPDDAAITHLLGRLSDFLKERQTNHGFTLIGPHKDNSLSYPCPSV